MWSFFIGKLLYGFHFGKKALMVVTVFFAVIFMFGYFINKDKIELQQQTNQRQNITYQILKDPEMNSSEFGRTYLSIYRVTLCTLTGDACTDSPEDDKKNAKNSVSGMLAGLMATPYSNPPASGTQWAIASLSNAGFIPDTYAAQGIGHAALLPFSPMWKLFRDVSYVILVLIVITLGFLIMFRANLGAQTVISIESALPKIVISMILIAFSFPIAGFMIDMMYVFMGLAVSILAPLDPTGRDVGTLHEIYVTKANMGLVWSSVFPDSNVFKNANNPVVNFIDPIWDVARIGNIFMDFLPNYVNNIFRTVMALWFVSTVWGFLSKTMIHQNVGGMFENVSILGTTLGGLPKGWNIISAILITVILFIPAIFIGAGIFLGLLIILTVILLMIRIFLMLLMGYIRLLMLVIFAPLILLFEAIPGQNTFGNWITGLIGELIMFPAVIILLMVGNAITSMSQYTNTFDQTVSTYIWRPPFFASDGTGSLAFESMAILVGMGIIFLIPDLIKQLREWMGVKPFPVKASLGTYFAGVGAIAGAGLGGAATIQGLRMSTPGLARSIVGSAASTPGARGSGGLSWLPDWLKEPFR